MVLTEEITGLSSLRVFVSFTVLFCSLFAVRFSILVIGFINVNLQCIFHSGEMGLNGIDDGITRTGCTIADGSLQLNSVRYAEG